MANSYYDATGTLQLNVITPVIKALFGRFNMDAEASTRGEVFIAHIRGKTFVTWEDIGMNLESLGTKLKLLDGYADEMNEDAFIKVIRAFVGRFGSSSRVDLEFGPYDMHAEAEFETLFEMALAFDDGHGLHTLKIERMNRHWTRPMENFDSEGVFLGRHFQMVARSNASEALGPGVEKALESGAMDIGCMVLLDHVTSLLQGIGNSATRREITLGLATMLSSMYSLTR